MFSSVTDAVLQNTNTIQLNETGCPFYRRIGSILLLVLTFLTFARDKRPGVIKFSARFYNQYFIGQGNVGPGPAGQVELIRFPYLNGSTMSIGVLCRNYKIPGMKFYF